MISPVARAASAIVMALVVSPRAIGQTAQNVLPFPPAPVLSSRMSPDPEVDAYRTSIIGLANNSCRTNPDTSAAGLLPWCRQRTVLPMAMGVGIRLAEQQTARNEHRPPMGPQQLQAVSDRLSAVEDPAQRGRVMAGLWSQSALDCGSLTGEDGILCQQKAQFNAGLTLGVQRYVNGNQAHLFDDLKPSPLY